MTKRNQVNTGIAQVAAHSRRVGFNSSTPVSAFTTPALLSASFLPAVANAVSVTVLTLAAVAITATIRAKRMRLAGGKS